MVRRTTRRRGCRGMAGGVALGVAVTVGVAAARCGWSPPQPASRQSPTAATAIASGRIVGRHYPARGSSAQLEVALSAGWGGRATLGRMELLEQIGAGALVLGAALVF